MTFIDMTIVMQDAANAGAAAAIVTEIVKYIPSLGNWLIAKQNRMRIAALLAVTIQILYRFYVDGMFVGANTGMIVMTIVIAWVVAHGLYKTVITTVKEGISPTE